MKILTYSIAMLLTLAFLSCRENSAVGEYETIQVNFDDLKRVDVGTLPGDAVLKVDLQTTDNSLLTYIEQMEIEDGRIFLYDKSRVLAFDTDGSFLFGVGRRGHGPGEYTKVNSFFIEDGKVCLYDDNMQALLIYDTNGNFIEKKDTEVSLSSLYPQSATRFVGKRNYRGDKTATPTLAVLDRDLKQVAQTDNRFLASGVGTFDYCSSYDGNTLYWEFLNDTIFSLKESGLYPRYFVDFGEYAIPKAVRANNASIGDIIEYVNSATSKLAMGIRYVQEDGAAVRFIFGLGEELNYGRYDKRTKQMSAIYFYDSRGRFAPQYFMKYHDGQIILSASDPESDSNPFLLFVEEDKLP